MPRYVPLLIVLLAFGRSSAADKVQFNRDVRPILSDACFACHGPDKNKRKAKLRLDDRANAVEKNAIVPGKPNESELLARLKLPADDKQHMPPAESHKTVTPAQINTLARWIAEGAEYQPHWSYIPPQRGEIPRTKTQVPNAIDAFVLAELEKRGLTLSPETDRRTLLRRVTLDLTGLPPTPAEIEAFVSDPAPNAYEKVVDRLLASPHYGERMATPWLDLVRFADTVGYHGDQNQRIFPYRDWVIEAFNANMPFDQFTRDQIAGDLLTNPTPAQLVATGFNRLNMMTREGGAQPKEYLAKYQADRVRTVGVTWLGSTTGCAECHDHKYDPITAKDFYSLGAFFADVRQWGVYSDYAYTPNPDLKGWSNDHPFPPEIEVENAYLKKRAADLKAELLRVSEASAKANAADPAKSAGFAVWASTVGTFLGKHPTGWQTPATAGAQDDGSVALPPVKGKELNHLALAAGGSWVAAVKLELLPDPAANNRITRDGQPTTVQLTVGRRSKKTGMETKLPLAFGHADRSVPTQFHSTEPVFGLANGWRTTSAVGQPHTAVWLLDKPVLLARDDEFVAHVGGNVGRVRVSVSPFGFDDLTTPATDERFRQLFHIGPPGVDKSPLRLAYLLGTAVDTEAFAKASVIRKQIAEQAGGKAWTQVTVATPPITTRVLPRGNWMDDTGAVVEPAVPHFLPQPKVEPGTRLTRLDLAKWITSPDNPLTARVFVNRLWKQFYGTGLSAVMEDVGGQGEPPSHPELLDWLAVEFADKWDVKKLARLMVTSATYRQASRTRPEVKDADPNNRLLSFLTPRRLEAEFVRDSALAAAGLLTTDLGGPSAKPYQPDGYYANIQFPDRRYAADRGPNQYRRGLYTHWQRTFLHPMLANFDAPSREECTATRATANTPQQALTLLNDPTFVEAAKVLGGAASAKPGDDAAKLSWLFEKVLGRTPSPAEGETLSAFLAAQRTGYKADPASAAKLLAVGFASPPDGDAGELAAWAATARVVLNLHEAITRY